MEVVVGYMWSVEEYAKTPFCSFQSTCDLPLCRVSKNYTSVQHLAVALMSDLPRMTESPLKNIFLHNQRWLSRLHRNTHEMNLSLFTGFFPFPFGVSVHI